MLHCVNGPLTSVSYFFPLTSLEEGWNACTGLTALKNYPSHKWWACVDARRGEKSLICVLCKFVNRQKEDRHELQNSVPCIMIILSLLNILYILLAKLKWNFEYVTKWEKWIEWSFFGYIFFLALLACVDLG